MKKEKHYLTENAKLVAEWDWEKNEKSPDQYTFGSHQKVWWICPKCADKTRNNKSIIEKIKKVGSL